VFSHAAIRIEQI